MMTKLREMSVIFLWILVFAFLGLMVVEWGMDYTGIRTRRDVIGKIDGQKITIEEFQKALQQAYAAEKERTGSEPDEEQMKKLRDEVWESLIQQVIFEKAIKQHGIQVTDKELAMYILNNPPQELRQNPNLMTDGKFDMQKYQEALRNPNIDWRPVENYYRQVLPYQKLQSIIASAAIVTEAEVKDEFARTNLKAQIEYLYFGVSQFSKKPVEASEEEIRKYYETHKDEFKVEEKRKLKYVLFPTQPTAEDSARTYRLAKDILQDAKRGEDFAKLADEYSEDPTVKNNHGDLGYFEKSAMVPEFAEAAFSAQPGEIVGPVKTQFGLHIIKVVDRKREEGKLKVRASHILLKFNPSINTIEEAQYAANNFVETARDEGFEITADNMKYEIKETPPFPKRNYIPGLGALESAVRWAFKADEGDISDSYRSPQGYVVFQVAEIQPAGFRPFEEVKDVCKNRVEFEKRKELAKAYALQFDAVIQRTGDFQEAIQQDTARIAVLTTTKEFTLQSSIPGIGYAPEIAAAAFKLPLNKPSQLLETSRGFYYIKVLKRDTFDEQEFARQEAAIRQRLLQQKQQQLFLQWYNQSKEQLKIEDYRDEFYRS